MYFLEFFKSFIKTFDSASEKTQRIKYINSVFKQACAGQKCIDDFSNITKKEINNAEFLNHIVKTFASEKLIKVTIQKFISASINTIINDFGFSIDVTDIININDKATQNLKTITFFNMLIQAFTLMSSTSVLEDDYRIKCRISKKGLIISIIASLKSKHRYQAPKKYIMRRHTYFLHFNCLVLLAKQNEYVFSVLEDSTSLIFRFAPK